MTFTLLSLTACSDVEFKDIPQNSKNCSGEACIDPGPIDPIDKDAYVEKVGSVETEQKSEGGKVDILVVVDNSISMEAEQKKMGKRFGDFVSELGNVDWRLAFTTTDARYEFNNPRFGGRLLNLTGANNKLSSARILTPDTPSLQQVFRNTIDRSSDIDFSQCNRFTGDLPCGDGNEQPLLAMIQSMSMANDQNSDFYRDDAALAVIVLSDEDEMSNGSTNATKPMQVLESVKSFFGSSKKFIVNGIIIQPGDNACYQENNPDGVFGTHVESLAGLTGGITRSICDEDYRPSMKAISQVVKKTLLVDRVKIEQKNLVPKSVKVKFIPGSNKVDWEFKDGEVVFKKLPADGTKIKVEYKYKEKKKKDKEHDDSDDETEEEIE
jgi:hypothetical protein